MQTYRSTHPSSLQGANIERMPHPLLRQASVDFVMVKFVQNTFIPVRVMPTFTLRSPSTVTCVWYLDQNFQQLQLHRIFILHLLPYTELHFQCTIHI